VWRNRTGAYTVLVEKPVGKTPLAQPGPRWKYDFKMGEEIGWGVECINLAQSGDKWRAVVNKVTNFRLP
jgi:hypothetical protein